MTATRTEERLAAALHARAEQVQPEDLRPLDLSDPTGPAEGRRTRGWALLVAAAAVAAAAVAAVAVPTVVAVRDHAATTPDPAGTPTPSVVPTTPTPTPTPKPEGHLVVRRTTADVDGDGRTDRVELQYRTGGTRRIFSARVTVTLATGKVTSDATGVSDPPVLDRPRDIDGDGRQVVITRSESGDADIPQVFAYREGRIQHLATGYGAPALVDSVDAQGHLLRFWFDDRDRLFSARSSQPFGPGDRSARMVVSRWRVVPAPGSGVVLDAARVPGPAQCFVPAQDETPHPC